MLLVPPNSYPDRARPVLRQFFRRLERGSIRLHVRHQVRVMPIVTGDGRMAKPLLLGDVLRQHVTCVTAPEIVQGPCVWERSLSEIKGT
jgi:hypothetical protein